MNFRQDKTFNLAIKTLKEARTWYVLQDDDGPKLSFPEDEYDFEGIYSIECRHDGWNFMTIKNKKHKGFNLHIAFNEREVVEICKEKSPKCSLTSTPLNFHHRYNGARKVSRTKI